MYGVAQGVACFARLLVNGCVATAAKESNRRCRAVNNLIIVCSRAGEAKWACGRLGELTRKGWLSLSRGEVARHVGALSEVEGSKTTHLAGIAGVDSDGHRPLCVRPRPAVKYKHSRQQTKQQHIPHRATLCSPAKTTN